VIENVKELCPEFKMLLFVDVELFNERGVPSRVSGTYDVVAGGVAESAKDRVMGEGAGVEQGAGDAWSGVGIADNGRTRTIEADGSAAIGIGNGNSVGRGVVVAGGCGEDSRHLPVTDDLIDDSRRIFGEDPPVAKGQVVDVAEDETVAHVEVSIAVVLVGVALILKISIVDRSKTRAGSVIKGVRKGIRRFVLQTVGVLLLQSNLERVVIRLCVGTKSVDGGVECGITVLRVSQTTGAGSAWRFVIRGAAGCRGVGWIGVWDRLIGVVKSKEL